MKIVFSVDVIKFFNEFHFFKIFLHKKFGIVNWEKVLSIELIRVIRNIISEGLVSYSMPQGIQRGSEVDLTDRTYDGQEDSGYLSGGLGQLVDGQKGPDNFRLDVNGNGKGNVALSAIQSFLSIAGYSNFF